VDAGPHPAENTPSARIIDAVVRAEAALAASRITDTPRLEAEVLLADTLSVARETLIASYDKPIEPAAVTLFFSRIERRLRGEPVAYITGVKEFMGFEFRVDRRALIPRPETETLVEHAVTIVESGACRGDSIADIGVGCGCIAVSLALLLPRARIHATDVSEAALELARENAERLHVLDRISFHAGSVFSTLPHELCGRFDIVVSNPPYVGDSDYVALDRGIREFEPASALRGGADGLDVFRELAAGAGDFLSSGGLLAVEIGEGQADAAAEILESAGTFADIETIRDLAGRQRVITGRKTA
jgi:release factor glutamine methyltransferase